MTWGPAQAGVAGGVAEAVAQEIVFDIEDVLIAAVWVDPAADDAEAVFANNLEATLGALAMGQQGLPSTTDIEERRTELWNPFFRRSLTSHAPANVTALLRPAPAEAATDQHSARRRGLRGGGTR